MRPCCAEAPFLLKEVERLGAKASLMCAGIKKSPRIGAILTHRFQNIEPKVSPEGGKLEGRDNRGRSASKGKETVAEWRSVVLEKRFLTKKRTQFQRAKEVRKNRRDISDNGNEGEKRSEPDR